MGYIPNDSEGRLPIKTSYILTLCKNCAIVKNSLIGVRMARKRLKFNKNDYFLTMIEVRGLQYKVFLYPDKVYDQDNPGSYAHVVNQDREMVFRESSCDLMTIRHEVCHLFIKSTFYEAMEQTSSDDLEELVCETFSYFAEKMVLLSDELKEMLEIEKKERNGNKQKDIGK